MAVPIYATGKLPFTTGFDVVQWAVTGSQSWNSGDSSFTINGSWHSSVSNTCAQQIKGRFEIKNGAGLFCSSNSARTRRVEFFIDATGEQPVGVLRAVGMTATGLNQSNMNLFSRAPLPPDASLNDVRTFELRLDDQGWKVIYTHPSQGDRVYLKIDFPFISNFQTLSVYSDLMDNSVNNTAGFFSSSNVKLFGLILNSVGVEGNPYPNASNQLTLYSDDFGRAAQNPYNPAGATYAPQTDGNWIGAVSAGAAGRLELDGSGNLVMRSVITGKDLVAFLSNSTNKPFDTDTAGIMVKAVFDSGKPGFYLSGILRYIYFNSTIDGGVVHSITVETNGTR